MYGAYTGFVKNFAHFERDDVKSALQDEEHQLFEKATGVRGSQRQGTEMEIELYTDRIDEYLKCDEIIDYKNEAVAGLADTLQEGSDGETDFIRKAYEYVRDRFPHSADAEEDRITIRASEVLAAGHGICFAKSHLLAAILRAKGVPAGFCYQKLILDDKTAPVLIYHGLNGVYIREIDRWIRLDARGNKEGVDARFSLDREQLAFPIRPECGEEDGLVIFPDPDELVIESMREAASRTELWENLPAELGYRRRDSLLKSTYNTRALPTGDYRYIRSDAPKKLTDDEVRWLSQNGITTIIDLRGEKEYEKKPCRLETEEGFTYYHMPLTTGGVVPESPEAVPASYVSMLDENLDRVVNTIMDADSNVLYFCAAGKDRTGVVSAAILRRLGYDDETIISDYLKSKENLYDRLVAYVERHPEVQLATVIPREENIRAVLEHLDTRGRRE